MTEQDQGQVTSEGQSQGQQQDGGQGTEQQQPYFVAQTKEEFEQRFGPTRQEGRQSYEKWLLEQTGAEKPEDVVAAWKDAQEVARQLEGEQVQQVRTEYEDKLKAERESAATLRKEYALRDALRDAGINGERVPLALRVADMSKLSVKENNVEGIEDTVSAIKEASPEWFGGTSVGRGSSPGEGQTITGVESMSKEEFAALQQRVMTGQTAP